MVIIPVLPLFRTLKYEVWSEVLRKQQSHELIAAKELKADLAECSGNT